MVCIANYINFAINNNNIYMTTNTKINTPQESIAIIENAIRETKTNWKAHSNFYLLWGWGISIACMLQYALIQIGRGDISFYHWPAVIFGCVVASIWMGKKQDAAPTTFQYDLIGKLWIVLAISFAIMGFISGKFNLPPSVLSLLIAGIGTLTSGLIMQYKPLTVGGIILFIGCLTCTFVDETDMLLINAISLILGYIIPGYLLKKSTI